MYSQQNRNVNNLEADMVVVGGGGAGLSAALAAAESGVKNIIVLEKRNVAGGNTAMSSGLFAADSQAQKRQAIDARSEVFFKMLTEFAHWKLNPRIVRSFIDKSADTIRWLEAKGLFFECYPMYPNQIATWHQARGNRGAEMISVLIRECYRLGVRIILNTPVRKIIKGSDGNITGVLAESNNRIFTISSKVVILATGGYGGNKELLKKYAPTYRDNMLCDGLLHSGDGLIMALEAGANTEGLGLLLMSGPQIPNSVTINFGDPPDVKTASLMAIALEPNTLWVNKEGMRFADETLGFNHYVSANTVNRQPENLCYTLLDSEIVRRMENEGLIIGAGKTRFDQRSKMPGLKESLEKQAIYMAQVRRIEPHVKISDSLGEIAEWMGAEPEVLEASVKQYNKDCSRGFDSLFSKDRKYMAPIMAPPFYAIKSNSDFIDTVGGIKINERMEVMDTNDNPIKGLYAAGVCAGGWQGDTYCAVLSGSTSGFAVNSGRIAAENAVEQIKLNDK